MFQKQYILRYLICLLMANYTRACAAILLEINHKNLTRKQKVGSNDQWISVCTSPYPSRWMFDRQLQQAIPGSPKSRIPGGRLNARNASGTRPYCNCQLLNLQTKWNSESLTPQIFNCFYHENFQVCGELCKFQSVKIKLLLLWPIWKIGEESLVSTVCACT